MNLNKKVVCTKSKNIYKYILFKGHTKRKLRQFPIQENNPDRWNLLPKIPKLPSRFSTTNDEDNGHDVCDVELEDSDDADDDDEVDDEDEDVAE